MSVRAAVAAAGKERDVIVQPVTPWGAFTNALNTAVRIACEIGVRAILFQVQCYFID